MSAQAYCDLVDAVYAATPDPDSWRTLFGVLELHLGAVSAIYDRPEKTPTIHQCYVGNLDPAFIESYNTYYHATNVWAMNRRLYASEVALCQKLIDVPTLERSEFYTDWLRPQGYKHSLTCNLRSEGDRTLNLGLVREDRRGEFTETEARLFERLTPHLHRVVDVNHRLGRLETSAAASGSALDALEVGAMLVDGRGAVLSLNAAAQQLLADGRVLHAKADRLALRSGPENEALQEALRRAAGVGGQLRTGSVLAAMHPERGTSYSIAVSPHSGQAGPFRTQPLALVLITDPERELRLSLDALRARYGLTPAEARLAIALCAGSTLTGYGQATGVSGTTVKTHLAQAFAKLGVARQADLVRRLLGDPALRLADGRAGPPG